MDEAADFQVHCKWVLYRMFEVNLITIAATILCDNDIAISCEIVDDSLNGSLSYSDLRGKLAHANIGSPSNQDKD